MTEDTFIRFAAPDFGDEEVAEVVATLRSGWITTGGRTAQFEKEFARYVDAPLALGVNSCTAGLHLALAALGIGPGDEVITTPLTFCATVNTIIQVGATPVLADVGKDLNIDPEDIARKITSHTRAIMPVHFGGLACEMDEIWKLAADHGLFVIEDAAHAAGSSYNGRPIGSGRSDAVAFSFYATKNLTTGEGGMVTTASAPLEQAMRTLCLHGISRDAWNRYSKRGSWKYEVTECGFKYNLSDLMSAIGIHQLRKLDRMNARRAEIAKAYTAAFADLAELEVPPGASDPGHSWQLYALRLNPDQLAIDRSDFIDQMQERGIGCSVHFIPIPLHPLYQRVLPKGSESSRRALEEYPRLVSLPIYSGLTDNEVARVIAAVKDVVYQGRSRTQLPVPAMVSQG